MRYYRIVFLTLCILLFMALHYCRAASINELIENAKAFDGRIIRLRAEAIGDIMKRGDFVWLNVSDQENAIGVWMPKELAAGITFTGDYKHVGDSLDIVGEFHRACPEHSGELDIHAKKLRVIAAGAEKASLINRKNQKLAFLFLGIAICLGILKMLIDRYRKT